jgi:hypothetical protein
MKQVDIYFYSNPFVYNKYFTEGLHTKLVRNLYNPMFNSIVDGLANHLYEVF